MVGMILTMPAVIWGIIFASIIIALGLSWPVIKWIIEFPGRLKEAKRAEELDRRENVVGLLEKVRDEPIRIRNAYINEEIAQINSEARLARAQLKEMGFKLPPDQADNPDHNWPTFAAQMIPIIRTRGIEQTIRNIDLLYDKERNKNNL